MTCCVLQCGSNKNDVAFWFASKQNFTKRQLRKENERPCFSLALYPSDYSIGPIGLCNNKRRPDFQNSAFSILHTIGHICPFYKTGPVSFGGLCRSLSAEAGYHSFHKFKGDIYTPNKHTVAHPPYKNSYPPSSWPDLNPKLSLFSTTNSCEIPVLISDQRFSTEVNFINSEEHIFNRHYVPGRKTFASAAQLFL